MSMPPPDRMKKSSVNSTCQTSGTNCTISDGTPAVPPFAPMLRIRTWKDVTLSYLDYVPAASIQHKLAALLSASDCHRCSRRSHDLSSSHRWTGCLDRL